MTRSHHPEPPLRPLLGVAPQWATGDVREAVMRYGAATLVETGLVGGIPLITHSRLAAQAHCAVSTVYRHWQTKPDLLHAVMQRTVAVAEHHPMDGVPSAVVTVARRGGSVSEACTDLAASTLQTRRPVHDMFDTLQTQAAYLDDELRVILQIRIDSACRPLLETFTRLPGMYPVVPAAPDSAHRVARLIACLARPGHRSGGVDLAAGVLAVLGSHYRAEPDSEVPFGALRPLTGHAAREKISTDRRRHLRPLRSAPTVTTVTESGIRN